MSDIIFWVLNFKQRKLVRKKFFLFLYTRPIWFIKNCFPINVFLFKIILCFFVFYTRPIWFISAEKTKQKRIVSKKNIFYLKKIFGCIESIWFISSKVAKKKKKLVSTPPIFSIQNVIIFFFYLSNT